MSFQKKKLKNGMTVVHEHRDLPVVSFSIANPFAASHETSDVKGIAHFIEHLLFTGTKTRTHEDISREIEKKGGILNAFTAQDVTSFWFKLPSEHLFSGMDILIDMIKNPAFKAEKFDKEKKVVLEEIKMYHDNPQRHVFEKIEENLFGKPFGEGIAGSAKTLNPLTREFVEKYYFEKYSPEHFIVTITGNADFEKVCEYLEEQFESKNEKLSEPQKIVKQNNDSVEERPGLDQSHFVLATHFPNNDKQNYVLEVLDAFLASGMSSRLFLKIREEKGLAYTVSSAINKERTYAYYSIYVGTTKEAIPEVKKLILEGFEYASEKMNEDDLREAKERLVGLRRVLSEESSNVMNELMFEELMSGDAENYYKHEDQVMKVSLDEVKALAKELIKEYSTAAIVPK